MLSLRTGKDLPRRRSWVGRGGAALLALAAVATAFRLSAAVLPIRSSELPPLAPRLVRFADRAGQPLAALLVHGEQACQPVSREEIPTVLVNAFVAAEDQRFFAHHGVDARALCRAAWQAVRARRVVSGGSTLTMQLARLLHPRPRTILSKLLEIHQAWRLEAGMTKAEILTAYLNRVPMGGNLVGVGVGARLLCGVPIDRLNLAQASLLAALPQRPTQYDPRRGASGVEARRKYVLQRMVACGFVEPRRAEWAAKSRLHIPEPEPPLSSYQFLFHVLHALPPETCEVQTTLDADCQRLVVEQVRLVLGRLKDQNVTNAAVLVLDNHTGQVLAYVGSASFRDAEHAGQVDGVQAKRQPGSSLKPFVYALALERGYTAASVLPDVPAVYALSPMKRYAPENYSKTFHGPVLLRAALANSYNVPACAVTHELGVQSVLDQLARFGFTSLDNSADYYGLGVVLGGGEVTLFELARAYLALARGGKRRELTEVVRVDGKPGEPREEQQTVCDPETAFLITDILSDAGARAASFGRHSVLDLPFPTAAKTGTSSRHRDNWTVGYTRDFTVAVWVGNFDGSPMRGTSGITGAGPLFARIMYGLYRGRDEPEGWSRPADMVIRKVCALSGKRPNRFCPHVREELFRARLAKTYLENECTWHRLGTFDTRTGLPARADCPAGYREQRVLADVPSEFQVEAGGRP